MEIGAVLQNGGGGQGADAGLGDTDGADAGKFLVDHRIEFHRKAAAVPLLGPMRRAPARLAELQPPFDEAVFGLPVGFQPGADFGTDGVFGRFVHGDLSLRQILYAQACIISSR